MKARHVRSLTPERAWEHSKLTAWRGAAEIAGGWPAWQAAGLPIERPVGR